MCYERKRVQGIECDYLWGWMRACCYFIKGGQNLVRGFKTILVSMFLKFLVVTRSDQKINVEGNLHVFEMK